MKALAVLAVVYLIVGGAPLFVVLAGLSAMLFYFADLPISALGAEIYRMAQSPVLVAIPLFTFAGYLLSESTAPARLVRFSRNLLGWMPGGTAIVGLLLCSVFTAFTGASGVTIIALGGLLYPLLLAQGYTKDFSRGFITSSGSIGLLLPPSLPVILYGMFAEVQIDRLFLAGVLPSVLMLVVFSLYSIFFGRGGNGVARRGFSRKKLYVSARRVVWEIPLPLLLVWGMYSGFFTITELATLTVVYVLVVEVAINRDIGVVRDLPRITLDSMLLVGSILMILGAALGFTSYLVDEQIPMRILDWMTQSFAMNRFAFLMGLNVFLLVVGCLVDIFSAIIIFVPLIVPIAEQLGINPVHLGIIFLTNLQIGYSTPPVGMNLFITSSRLKVSVLRLYKAALPFIALLLFCLLLITYVPQISLFALRLFD